MSCLNRKQRDAKVEKASRKTDSAIQKIKQTDSATFHEKNGLQPRSKSPKKKSVPAHKRSTSKPIVDYNNLEREIRQLQLQHEKSLKRQKEMNFERENIMIDPMPMDRRNSIKHISQIGKLDPERLGVRSIFLGSSLPI